MTRVLNAITMPTVIQMGKYCAIGAIVNGAGYLLFLVLLHVGLEHKLSATITYLLGILASFWLNRNIVFESAVPMASSLFRLCVMLLSGYILNIGTLYLGVDMFGYRASIIQLASVCFVSLFFYFVNRYYVHQNNQK